HAGRHRAAADAAHAAVRLQRLQIGADGDRRDAEALGQVADPHEPLLLDEGGDALLAHLGGGGRVHRPDDGTCSSAIWKNPLLSLGCGLTSFRRTLVELTGSKAIVDGWLDAVAQSTCRPVTGTQRSPSRYVTSIADGSTRCASVVKDARTLE